MFAVEIFVLGTHRRHFDYSHPRAMDATAIRRIGERYSAFCFCLLGMTCFFVIWDRFVPHFIDFFWLSLPALIVLPIFFFWMAERYGRASGPVDEFLVFGHALTQLNLAMFGRAPLGKALAALKDPHIYSLLRGVAIKCYFIPIMLLSCLAYWYFFENELMQAIRSMSVHLSWALVMQSTLKCLVTLALAIDVTFAIIGYTCSMRLTDSQFTSTEPTLLGWAVALVCYPPFAIVFHTYVWSKVMLTWPEQMFLNHPVLSTIISVVILILTAIYSWSTVSFGLRFSNLSNRGIICHGPYAWIRHPAYTCKNIAWWLALIPSLAQHPLTAVGLLGINVIYGLRAWTEERHLMRTPHYREYCQKVRSRCIPGIY